MTPIKFDGYQKVLGAPKDWDATRGPCQGLPVVAHEGVVYSVWKLTLREKLSLLFNRKVRLAVVSGKSQPPVWLDVIKIGLAGA